ncbi:MAG: Omp28-related outer membrane protein [Flavobacteriales bacterium]|nr:Omp28-related outer membrane protein [Flavobacteriales bacterium]
MKKILLTGLSFAIATGLFAQTFSDDFDSYTTGTNLTVSSADWTTWTPATPSEDVLISSADAASGANSLYFESNGGGPVDIILPFSQIYNSGQFSFEANFNVEAGKGAYFNLQGTLVAAEIWAMDCFMLDDGTIKLSNQGTPYITSTYPTATWFNLRIDMDLTTNVWELFINDISQGTFANPTGQIGILNLYPTNPTTEGGNNTAGFYVDDVQYTHTPEVFSAVNGGMSLVNAIDGIAGANREVVASVRNIGLDAITSFDITYDYNGSSIQESVGSVNLVSLESYEHTFATPAVLAAGSNVMTVTISNVNGAGQDADATDDAKSIIIDPIVPAEGKVVVGEEATGTWCGWCPRGTVAMDEFATLYPTLWAGIAVHNGDPMADAVYDGAVSSLVSGYPNAFVDRGAEVDPGAMGADFLSRLQTAPKAFISNTSTWDPVTRVLEVTVTADFQANANSAYKLACVITEDGVTGGAGYAQTNYYAGGAEGVMGGYELLGDPVPAADMVYDHVARGIQPSFAGEAGVFPPVVNAGEQYSSTYSFTLPVEWNINNMHIIGLLIDNTGKIDNAGKSVVGFAGLNDLASSTTFTVFPNPATTSATINISLDNKSEVAVRVLDMTGKEVASKDYGVLASSSIINLNTVGYQSGVYLVEVTVNGQKATKRLIIK